MKLPMQRWKALVAQEATTELRPGPRKQGFDCSTKGYYISSAQGNI
uniref:Uncharacterized protein n=1 Tax=Utricularia reniformis TaxID=192314 RepID=A0A1Y0B3N1_9LAMI|nr:hypothetical protein AEK19_MT0869 [Utricularia reniformis]YP_009382266.1 hypothetical protein AEK19_MT1840 [Utricularia reniformis]ART31101.1 hypothetical protein AEK19_MT0869 [Utricularia reniformis]ART32010.1 hypothetical protein AEK19_MT1840 [Utricularia reniformis]